MAQQCSRVPMLGGTWRQGNARATKRVLTYFYSQHGLVGPQTG